MLVWLEVEYCLIQTQPIQFNDCFVRGFTVFFGFFENDGNVLCFSVVSVNKPIVVSDTTEIFVTFGVPVSYLYWMRVIEFFHW